MDFSFGLKKTPTKKSRRKSSNSIRGKAPSSDEYVERLKVSQKKNIKIPEDAEADGYESDHLPTLSQRCGLAFRVTKRLSLTASSNSNNNNNANDLRQKPPQISPIGTKSSMSFSATPSTPNMDEIMPASLPSHSIGMRYSLRSVIGDGTQQPDGPTVMQRRHLRPNGCHLDVSHWSADGLRPYMEDRYVIEELRPKKNNDNDDVAAPMTFFGVFDGHGGDRASQFCSDRLTSYIRYQNEFPNDIGKAMKQAFHSIDKDFVRTGLTDGSTACVCVVVGKQKIICANAGDSRAISIRKDGSVAKLSRDHKPCVPDETKRISDLGGRIVYWGRWRVEGVLAVSRSIGDGALKPFITADPEICEYNIEDNDILLVIASDGIWDVMDNLDVAELMLSEVCVHDKGKCYTKPEHFKRAARKLCDKAGLCGSTDNLSVVVVDLKSYKDIDDF